MELVLIIFNQLVFMLILIIIGFLLVKTKLLSDEGAKSLTNIILYVSSPIIIISSYHSSFDMIKLKKLIMSFLIAIFIHVLFIVLTKLLKIKNPVDISAATLSNAAFMGVPLISAALGEEAVFYLSAYIAINLLFTWTFSVKIYSPEQKIDINNIIKTPITIAIVIGLIIFFTQIKLPNFLLTVVDSIKTLNTPLAMFVLGSYVANISFTDFRKNLPTLILPTFYKLILFPVIALIIMRLLPDTFNDLKVINMIAAASPSAINVALFARKYNSDYKRATELVCLTTIFCILTIPMFVYILG